MAGDPLSEFGLRVRVLREQRQLTIERLATLADIDPAHLGMIELRQREARSYLEACVGEWHACS
jgi:transcriptional regulator with XRE-family HTH domain